MPQDPLFSTVNAHSIPLQEILDRLQLLKYHSGQMKADGIWLDDGEPRSLAIDQALSTDGSPAEIINVTIASLQRMKRTLVVLQSIVSSLEEVVSTVQKHTQPALHHHGMNSLPSEILSRIFMLACSPKTSEHLKLAKVCRRFRDIAVDNSHLWTYITPRGPPEWWELQLSRSGNRLLVIDFHSHAKRRPYSREQPPCKCAEYLTLAMKHSRRWRKFTFAVSHSHAYRGAYQDAYRDEYRDEYREQIQVLLADLHLPHLTHLSIRDQCTEAGDSKVIRSWRTPLLEDLQCHQDMNRLLASVEDSIAFLDLTVCKDDFDSSHILHHPKLSGVEELNVKLTDIRAWDDSVAESTDDDPSTSEQMVLHALRDLTIDFSNYQPEDIINNVFKHMQAPELETMSLTFNLFPEDYIEEKHDEETDEEELMEKFESIFEWLAKPLPELRQQFPSLKLIVIQGNDHKRVDEETIEEELTSRLREGWEGTQFSSVSSRFCQSIPEIKITLDAMTPPFKEECSCNDCTCKCNNC